MKCESCGHENLEGARFCASCGVALQTENPGEGWVGRIIGGRFRITRILGEGGMGVVYAGEQQMGSTVRKVAIKTLHQHLSRDPAILARFHRECGTVAQLEHPNTIKVYDFGATDDGTLYIAMEFVEGRSLDKVLEQEGPLSPRRVVDILKQVAGALDEAHDQGIVHRDLKPENIVLGERLGNPDFVKVLDFGIAARRESADRAKEQKLTQQGMVLGTPPYMSPEQFIGQELDRRSDIYSLGVMTYEMLTGRLPFRADTAWQWATEHITAQPAPIDQTTVGAGIPARMRDVVMRSLGKRPEERPSTAGEFVRELESSIANISGPLSVARTEMMQATGAGSITSGSISMGSPTAGIAQSSPRIGTDGALSATQGFEIPTRKRTMPLVLGGLAVLGLSVGAFAFFSSPSGEAAASGGGPSGGGSAAVPSLVATTPAAEGSGGASSGSGEAEPDRPTSGGAPTVTPAASGGRSTSSGPPTKPPDVKPPDVKPPAQDPDPKPPAQGPECSACPTLATSGLWAQAGLAYSSCDAAGKSVCSKQVRKTGPAQVEAAAGNCQKIRAIVRGLAAMGEKLPDRPKLKEALSKCK
jgi:eukaryotic-like serine/threonine-protein kinase